MLKCTQLKRLKECRARGKHNLCLVFDYYYECTHCGRSELDKSYIGHQVYAAWVERYGDLFHALREEGQQFTSGVDL